VAVGEGGVPLDARADAPPLEIDGSDLDAGPTCAVYCADLAKNCAGDDSQFANVAECSRACTLYPVGPQDGGTLPPPNSIECHAFHASIAGPGPAVMGHCWHAGPFGYGGCGNVCDDFCPLAMTWCAQSAGGAPFGSMAECLTACNAFAFLPPRDAGGYAYTGTGPASGNSGNCREYHLMLSFNGTADRDRECPNVGVASPACR
jgi:hypothetical protein